MAVTAIWDIKGRVDKVINYVQNPSKVTEKSYDEMAMLHAIEGAIEYATNDMKTEERKFVSTLNMMNETRVVQAVIITHATQIIIVDNIIFSFLFLTNIKPNTVKIVKSANIEE